ncbi:PepSY domain-containing protein [Lysinibacillus pakistanensis]|uniref:PepSY domain-containing protein n=3 Tax=Lysinibacillus pakistanensis TaxID=759811 RepID=A0AAX3X2Y2_9BACI|nr:PepSY domain-containing protein [Lysinibacillus pakistanensis]MDM5233179.1 PepSY domain-containing protein [Lysinibacillus pakistanensis]WHY48658.1 PepSY domain-containing protein [Lysinibacillus pakistanensis]WHY53672.1 PepSY domain-containing protein [Lysinibacillus pakistanensis]
MQNKEDMFMVMPSYNQRISPQQAMQIAVQRVPGQIIHYGMDMENGTLVYEIFILTSQNKIYEVEVNAKTGVIRKIEEENDSD